MPSRRSILTLAAVAAAVPLCLSAPSGATPGAAAATSPLQSTAQKPLARNVIVLLDDGGGYNHHEAGSLYDTGERAGEVYQEFPFQTGMSTYSYADDALTACTPDTRGYDPERAWSEWDYVTTGYTDSAAAATAMGTGTKTYNGAIGVGCDGETLANVVEAYEKAGRSTGLVSTSAVSSATPAGFSVHNASRGREPAIARAMTHSTGLDVIMGSGNPFYGRNGELLAKPLYNQIPKDVWDELLAGTPTSDADRDGVLDAFTLLQSPEQFQNLISGEPPKRVFGAPMVHGTFQATRDGDAGPYVDPFIPTVPTLSQMTLGALNVLSQNPEGFFLMAEGGGTDVTSAANQTGRMLEEEISFDRMVDAAVGWVEQHSNWGETLVVVLSDHETGYLTGPGSGPTDTGPVWTPLTDNGQGNVPGLQFNLTHHTNSLVPVYAKGDAGRLLRTWATGTDPVRGRYLDNTAIFHVLMQTLGQE